MDKVKLHRALTRVLAARIPRDCASDLELLRDYIEDSEPVKYGRWIESSTQKHVEVTYECSECRHEVIGEYEKTPFCGGCGARMDGDSND